jgi:hypothetical protein
MEPREKIVKMSEVCPDNGFSLTKKHVRFGRKPDCSLGIIAELYIQSFHFRLIIRSNHLPIIHNNEIGRISSIERKDVVFDKKTIFAFVNKREKGEVVRKGLNKTVKIQIKWRESRLSMMLELL